MLLKWTRKFLFQQFRIRRSVSPLIITNVLALRSLALLALLSQESFAHLVHDLFMVQKGM